MTTTSTLAAQLRTLASHYRLPVLNEAADRLEALAEELCFGEIVAEDETARTDAVAPST